MSAHPVTAGMDAASQALREAQAYAPPAPRTLADTQLPFLFVVQLACKIFFHTGPQRAAELASRIRLPVSVIEPVIDFLRRERMCEVTSNSSSVNLMYGLTDLGRSRAEEYVRVNQYSGPAPVSLQAYTDQVLRQSRTDVAVTREQVARAYGGIVIRPDVLDRFGAAMNSGRAIFVYGPAGCGKTFIVEKLARLLAGAVYLPYALLVGSQVIQFYDPLVHTEAAGAPQGGSLLRAGATDARWVLCERPVVLTGGELTLAMLDLQFDQRTRHYAAPPQLKANNGLFIIDDLGRQLVPARDLMNRWIVPLDRRVDYLALHTGEKFMVPFDVTVVFSTNLQPADLDDEAFLRRLGYKIQLGPLDEAQYRALSRQVCAAYRIDYDDAALDYVLARFGAERRPLLACTPRDLFCQVVDQARYRGAPPRLDRELLDWAWDNYFVNGLQPELESTRS